MRLRFFFLLGSFLVTRTLLSQSSDLHALWTKKQGLSSNGVYCMVKDRDGFLWVGTNGGLNRFDGETFEVFKHSGDPNSIQSNSPIKLVLTSDQKLVIGFLGGGISIFDPEENRFENFPPGRGNLPKGHIEEIYETTSGELWLSVREHGMFRFKEGKFEHLFDLPDLDISGIDSARNRILDVLEIEGTMWFATNMGLYTMAKGEQKPTRLPNTNEKIAYSLGNLTYDLKSKLWMGSWTGGLFSYDLKTKEWSKYTYAKPCEEHCFTNIVMDVKILSENELALATLDKGFIVFNSATKKFQLQPYPNALKDISKPSRSIFIDESNNDLWLGTDEGLLQRSILSNVLNCSDSLVKNSEEFYYDSKHDLTFITTRFADGLHIIDHKNKLRRIVHVPVPEFEEDKTEFIVSIVQRSNGGIYVLSKECLWKLDLRSWRLKPVNLNKFLNIHRTSVGHWFTEMVRDPEDNLWIGHDILPILVRVDQSDSVSVVATKSPSLFVTETSSQIWMASGKGISAYDRLTQKISTWNVTGISCFHSETIIHDILSIRDSIWVATNFGLFRIKDLNGVLSCEAINADLGLSFETFGNLARDDSGNLWVVVLKKGVGKLQPDGDLNLFPFVDRHGNDLVSQDLYYDKLSAATMGNKKIVAISNRNGVYLFNPDSVAVSKELPVFSIKESTIPGRILDSDIEIPNKQPGETSGNTLNILFNLIYFKDIAKVRYAYRFKEFNAQWKFGDSKNSYISQHDLPNDKPITLEIKVCNEYNVWSKPLHITFQIDSPIWQRAWFVALSSLLLVVSVFGIVRFAISREKKKAALRLELEKKIFDSKIESEKEKLELKRRIYSSEIKALRSQMNPHFIFNSLNTLQDQAFGNKSAEATKYIGDFGLLLRKILTNSDYLFIKLKEEISMVELYLKMEALRFKDHFTWEIKVEQEIDLDSVEFPPMLVQPIVENAVLHSLLEKTGDRNLLVHFFVKQNRLICRVEDNGVGVLKHTRTFLKDGDMTSKGTALINDRIALLNEAYSLNGQLHVQDLSEIYPHQTGTRVELSFDLVD